jgi:hypothetical protein
MKEKLTMPCTEQQWEQEIKPRIEEIQGVEQPEWMPLTRGGYEYHIYEEFDECLFGRISVDGKWCTSRWGNNGKFFENEEETNSWDLMPYDNEIEAIKKEIAIKEKELAELKGRLNEYIGIRE